MEEICELNAFLRWCDAEVHEPIAAHRLDLRAHDAALLGRERYEDVVFLGCLLSDTAKLHVIAGGALVFPRIDDLPFDPYHHKLYRTAELFSGYDPARLESFEATFDQRVYAHFIATGGIAPPSIRVSLARNLHDHAMSEAMSAFLRHSARRVVAIMGGHRLRRAAPDYARVARIARRLSREGYLIASGGGPGAMEASHLGAYFAARPDDQLDEALATLGARSPEHVRNLDAEYRDADWMARAWRVWTHYPQTGEQARRHPSLGIPTWLYGHEPPTVFATHHAKFFANSTREDLLLMIALDGVLYTPGRAGTVQEIFQDACQNYYGSAGHYSPMVFMNRQYWEQTLPARPLLDQLMRAKPQAALIHYEDDEEAILARFLAHSRDAWLVR